jgi:hypothetical protein
MDEQWRGGALGECAGAAWLSESRAIMCENTLASSKLLPAVGTRDCGDRAHQKLLLLETLGRASLLMDAQPMSPSHSVATGHAGAEALSYLTG